ncbi:MAG: alpha/beta hydrolase [Anaerolineae bacterium]|nr:alpha/beta hydrolase [Anaerolineae bacterium]
MRRLLRAVLILLGVLLVAALVVPLLIPAPRLEGTVPVEQLADPDGWFVELNGVKVHYKAAGDGQPALLLLHGFAASVFSWREVMEPLAEDHTVVAFDRPGFGLTERPLPGEWQGRSPYSPEAQAGLTVALMDELGIDRAVLVGNSAGGTVAVLTALTYPDRVQALVLVDPAIYTGGQQLPGVVRWLLESPQARRVGPLFVRSIRNWGLEFGRSAWHDPSKITDEVWDGYTRPLQAENWDKGLYEVVLASRSLGLDRRLDEIQMPVLVITGDDDRIVPTEQSIRLAGELPSAELVVAPNCGHVPHEECPEPFLAAVDSFLAGLSQ